MKRFLAALGLVLCSQLAFGQHPNDARGFEAGKVYNFNDVDTVNTFNGNLMVHLPIGPAYHVNGALSYQLGLFYNSHCWRFNPNDGDETGTVTKAYPIGSFNAGFGWTLSLGRLFYGGDPEIMGATASWTYQSNDGADHNFYSTLHNGAGTVVTDVYYTHDGSYMRLSKVGAQEVVEFSDGTKNEFTQINRTTSPWSPSTTSKDWVLTGIADQFGNRVDIAYTMTTSFAEIWTITDTARTTSVYFKISATPSQSPTPSPANVVLDHIDTRMVNGTLATYSFATQVLDVPLPNTDTSNRANRISVTVLTAMTPPAGNPYSMTLNGAPAYDTTWVTNGVGAIRGQTPGVLTRLVLPTLGSIGWSHQTVQFTLGSHDPMRSPAVERPVGVVARTTYDASGQLLGTWTYGRRFSSVPNPCLPTPFCLDPQTGQPMPECPSGRSRQLTTWVTEPSVQGEVTRTTISYFSNYESISTNPNGDTCDTSAEGWSHSEHGLPFTRYASHDGRFLSGEVRTGNIWDGSPWLDGRGMVPDGGTRVRATYVTYQIDDGPYDEDAPIEYNATPKSSATYFYDDVSTCGTGSEPCYFTAVNNYGFDTYGHFRQASTDGNLPGNGNFRTTFTNYNAVPTTARWLLNTSSEQCTADESAIRNGTTGALSTCSDLSAALITKTQYDTSGALTARRTLLNPGGSLATSDLLATFAHDSHGNLTSEQYYGGDTQALGVGSDPFSPPANPKYAITHSLTYSGGVVTRDSATYDNTGGLTASDDSFDQSAGLVTDTKDVAGLTTHYNYDLLGRITSVQPPGVTQTVYTYADAALASSVFTPAKVFALTDASSNGIGKISQEYQYDPFGRLWRQKSLLPDDTWNIVQTDFDVLGRKTAVSQPERLTVAESSFVPAHKTVFSSYDPFGRARSVQAPDLSTTTFAFAGVRSVTRTVTVSTSAANSTSAPTTEIHDALGRLYQLTERSGATTSSSPVGTDTTTTYTYDFAGHLTDVETSGSTQHRAFHYDNRGVLTQEQHPEVGPSGNEFVYYGGYDARGHATSKRIGPANGLWDLSFVYDPAERLTNVYDSGSSLRPVQEYSFLSPTDSSAFGKGRLNQAIRYNYPDGLTTGTVVTETYKYASPSGRPSERDTLVENKNGPTRTTLQSIVQNFTYDQLGAISQVDDPTCSPACGGLALTGPTYTHKNGALTAVSSYAPAITYNADGSLFEVAHNASGSVKDTYTSESSGMSRPAVISFAGMSACTAPQIAQGISDKQVASGSPANLTVSATSASTTPLTYLWLKDGTIIPGETNPSCCTAPVTATANYTGRIINSCGQAESTARITVCGSPSIGTQPQSTTYTGTPVTLTVSADGCGTLTYQWYNGISPNGTAISGANSASYPASPTVTTQYWVRVTDSVGGVANSNTATVTVPTCNGPSIVTQPQSGTYTGTLITLSVVANGCAPFTYQWYQGTSGSGVLISGATSASYPVAPPTTTSYWVRVTDSVGGFVNSNTATITSCGNPSIVNQPQSATYSGTPIVLNVSASGCSPFTYQWYQGISGSGVIISGQTSASYVAAPAATTQYWVRVFDNAGGFVNSNTAIVTVSTTPLPTPGALTATLTPGTNTIVVTWGASPGADHYQLQRMDRGVWSTFDVFATTVPYTLSPSTTYVFHVRAVDSAGGSASPYTANDLATTMPFATLQAGVTTVTFSVFDQILTAINAVRLAHNDGSLTWRQILDQAGYQSVPVPASNVVIYAAHVRALRSAMDAALGNVQVATAAYTDSLTSTTVIKAVHITQLQLRAQ